MVFHHKPLFQFLLLELYSSLQFLELVLETPPRRAGLWVSSTEVGPARSPQLRKEVVPDGSETTEEFTNKSSAPLAGAVRWRCQGNRPELEPCEREG
jgi:hypothetical protein